MKPLLADEFSKLIEPYTPLEDSIAVAVSGGSDSLALILLLHEWALTNNTKVVGLTVDHCLRPESSDEANLVHQWLEERGIEHHTLIWRHSAITTSLQQKARTARYALISNWCFLNGVKSFMTAHHLQDQWETFLMRLSKGSGLTGLCCMKAESNFKGLRLIRPLLSIKAERLKKTLKRFNQPFVEDSSNERLEYARIRLRKLQHVFSREGLTPETIDGVRKRFQLTEDYLQQQLEAVITECVIDDCIQLDLFKKWHQEMAYRLLKYLLNKIGGHTYPLPYKSLENLYEKLLKPEFTGATAGGCYLKKIKGGLIKIQKEERTLKNN